MKDSRLIAPNRRDVLKTAGIAAGAALAGTFPLQWVKAADGKNRKILFFTKSSGFQHSVITRKSPDELAYAEKILIELGKEHGFDVTATKDGGYFTPERLEPFDSVVFYTTGDLTKVGNQDHAPAMPSNGKETLINWVSSGKGFLGLHCASDTFHSHGNEIDPYIRMLGGEFVVHHAQQDSKILVKDHDFGPIKDLNDFHFVEEWYILKNFAPDLHVICVQDTKSMREPQYTSLTPYPETWARMQGKGRVFYSSMGHREDVWKNPIFEKVLLGGLAWVTGNAEAKPTPNLKEAAPGVEDLTVQ